MTSTPIEMIGSVQRYYFMRMSAWILRYASVVSAAVGALTERQLRAGCNVGLYAVESDGQPALIRLGVRNKKRRLRERL